ncbi:MAG: PAS domain S-box protein [Candidatus Thorarchaeota archaeon]
MEPDGGTPESTESDIYREDIKTLLDRMDDFFFIFSLDGRILRFNKVAMEQLGYSAKELLELTVIDIHDAEEEEIQQTFEDMVSGKISSCLIPFISKDGRSIPVETKGLPGKRRGIDAYYCISRNMSHQIEIEDALRDSEKRFRELFDSSPVAMWDEDFSKGKELIDELGLVSTEDFKSYIAKNPEFLGKIMQQMKVVDVNQAAVALLEADSKDELLQSRTRTFTDQAYSVFSEFVSEMANNVTSFESEVSLVTLKGHKRRVLMRLIIPPGYEESLEKVIMSMIDISDLTRTKDMLSRERRAYRIVADAAVQTTSTNDLCFNILSGLIETIEFDLGTVRLYDADDGMLNLKASIGLPLDKITESVSPDDPSFLVARITKTTKPLFSTDVETDERVKENLPEIRELGIRTLIFWPILDPNGDVLGIINAASKQPKEIMEDERVLFSTVAEMFAAVLVRRKTEEQLRESEERFASFADHLPGPVFIKDHESRVLFVNKFMRGMNAPDSYTGRTNIDLFPNERAKALTSEDEKVLSRGPIERVEKRSAMMGRERDFRSYKFPIFREGRPPLIGGFSLDITDQLKAESQAEEAKSRAEFFNDLMMHDINNMHQGIMSSIELMLTNEQFPEQLKGIAESALNQVLRGVELIANVRKFSRVNLEEVELSPIDPFIPLSGATDTVRQSFPSRDIGVQVDFKEGKYKVQADDFLIDVFYNLLHNSVKFSAEGEAIIKVNARIDEDNDFLRIQIEDRGSGISDGLKEKVLTRLDDRSSRGTGIGLTLVNQIIERYKGDIWVEDRVRGETSKGTCFVIRIPLATD